MASVSEKLQPRIENHRQNFHLKSHFVRTGLYSQVKFSKQRQ